MSDSPPVRRTRGRPRAAGSAPQPPRALRIALLFNANKVYDRELIEGIAAELHGSREAWELFAEDDFRARLTGLDQWPVDGVIADFDDPTVAQTLAPLALPVVAVGGSYAQAADYPTGVPYVATDNAALVRLAHDHLVAAGRTELALYSLPEDPANRWAQQREQAFADCVPGAWARGRIHRGRHTRGADWPAALQDLTAWLHQLPRPVGIVAVNDARARHLLQACLLAAIPVPEQVAIVGIDNDPLTQSLTRIGLSSVRQGTHAMGRTAARLMRRLLHGGGRSRLREARVVVPPAGLVARASSRCTPALSPLVMQARHVIRLYGCQGLRNEQLARQVGVSRSTLEAAFRRELGSTVHRELLQHRLDSARALLRDAALPIARVAEQAGFGSAAYLHAVLRRELGTTPAALRAVLLQGG